MILHYIRISLRNISKYKTQTAISILAMAVSLTLMAIVVSMALSVKPLPILSQYYADRTYILRIEDDKSPQPGSEEMNLIANHQFKGVEGIHHVEWGYGIPVNLTANPEQENERSLIQDVYIADGGYLKFQGVKSVLSGKVIEGLSKDEVVITQKLAKKLFGKENAIGKGLHIHTDFYGNMVPDKIYTIKDVMENPSPNNKLLFIPESIFIAGDQFFDNTQYECYFVLREGTSPENLKAELNELLGARTAKLLNVKKVYSDREVMAVRNGIILFLILFVLVSFSNYLKQQLQLFRFRERELALRTCLGCQPKSLLLLLLSEISIVLLITLLLTLILTALISDFLLSRYPILFEYDNYSLSDALPISSAAIAILMVISMVAVAFTLRRIRHDQTGLALRMKPLPKHRLRNLGLTVQMTVCLVFTCITVLLFMAGKNIKEHFGIPDDVEKYRKCMMITSLPGVEEKAQKEIYDRIDTLESVESIYSFNQIRRLFTYDQENDDRKGISIIVQNATDGMDFYGLKSEEINRNVNPDKYILVSKSFRQKLMERNLWNGKTLNIPYQGEYEIKGMYDHLPFDEADFRESVVIYDSDQPDKRIYHRIIEPKKGRANEVKQALDDIIHDVIPNRIDIKIQSYYNVRGRSYDVVFAMIIVIYILSAISVITTMAAIYAGVSLDTRRRRKEMALRKLNGAGPKVIAMIFTRTYLWIISIAGVISLPICIIASDTLRGTVFPALRSDNVVIAYILGLLLIIAVTALTIAWKIRDIMRADPIEYLKE